MGTNSRCVNAQYVGGVEGVLSTLHIQTRVPEICFLLLGRIDKENPKPKSPIYGYVLWRKEKTIPAGKRRKPISSDRFPLKPTPEHIYSSAAANVRNKCGCVL